ncbi:MAG: zinc finger domain-containing protein [Candidatus Pacearchaeota archaeon]
MVKCNSCNYEGTEIVIFDCPSCKEKIVRCLKCRRLSIDYKCEKCGFKGP